MQAKAQGDSALLDKQTQAKQREIIIQGMFDLAKANIPMPVELKPLIVEMLQNIEVPLAIDNQQMEQALQQQQMQMQQQQMLQQGQGMPEEAQQMEMQQQ
jgi:hypothetical protein